MSSTVNSSHLGSILVVDDTPDNLHLLAGMLKERGYEIRPVPSGKLALQAARHDPPDLILLDIHMPEMNGYEVCERLKADERLKEIPVIFISALNETMDKVRAFGAGGVDYVTKPFEVEEVVVRVQTHLELRRQRRRLQESHDRLRRLETLRDNLVRMIIHDLRNPLTAMCSSLSSIKLEERGLPANVLEDIDQALSSARKMVQMVKSVLDVSRMEAGEMKLNLSECDMHVIVKEVLADLKSLASDRRLILKPRQRPATAVADRDLVARIVQNLVDNALKFTPARGRIHVSIAGGDNGVRVAVADTGPGIPVEFREKIFEKFGQAEALARQQYSAGLGLAFCKLAVEAHGGRIGVESEEGKGSTFWFELPREGPKQHALQQTEAHAAHGGQDPGMCSR